VGGPEVKWIASALGGDWWLAGIQGRHIIADPGIYLGGKLVFGTYADRNRDSDFSGRIAYAGAQIGKRFGQGRIKLLVATMIGGGLAGFQNKSVVWDDSDNEWTNVADYASQGFFALEPEVTILINLNSVGIGLSACYLIAPVAGKDVGGPGVILSLIF